METLEITRYTVGVLPIRAGTGAAGPWPVEVLLTRRPRTAVGPDRVEIIAGRMTAGEVDPQVTAARELADRAGRCARRWRTLGIDLLPSTSSSERIHLMACWDLAPATSRAEDNLVTEWVPLNDAVRQAGRGEIRDMKTIIALLWTRALLLGDLGPALKVTGANPSDLWEIEREFITARDAGDPAALTAVLARLGAAGLPELADVIRSVLADDEEVGA